MTSILLIDDDPNLSNLLGEYLKFIRVRDPDFFQWTEWAALFF